MNQPPHEWNRRKFLRLSGTGTLAMLAARMPVMAGPFSNQDFENMIPADKNLDPAWVKSLFARGEPQVFRSAELDKIGMPIGGICAGQLYLGGDGRLWHWDIFNQTAMTGDAHYAHPLQPSFPLEQGFSLDIGGNRHCLDKRGFSDIRFRGAYPIATVVYQDARVPLEVAMEAFSPFIPLETDDSSLPATVMQFTVKNTSDAAVNATLIGTLENAVCLYNRLAAGTRRNQIVAAEGYTLLECSAEKLVAPGSSRKPDIVFEDWSKKTYEGWSVEGTAFGAGPIQKSSIPSYQGEIGGDTERVVNSHATAPGSDLAGKDKATGKLTSRSFTIERNFIAFWIGGGNRKGKAGLNLLIDGKVVHAATGQDNNKMSVQHFDVLPFMGKKAVIEIVDADPEGWGNIGIGKITFSDQLPQPTPLEALPDYGTMTLALLGQPAEHASQNAAVPLKGKLLGELGRRLKLDPGQSATVTFVLTWHFPNLTITGARSRGRFYATRFDSALAVAQYVVKNFSRLATVTRLWRDTWYDSTLPYWFLDRTFLNTSILASSTCHRFEDGRFYGWEGTGCCAGTCTSVWYYAQAMARLFPDLERSVREQQDLADGIGFDSVSGGIYTRGEFRGDFVLDGQAGNVLRIYREHQMCPGNAFLKRNWAKTRQALDWLVRQDGNNDGIIDGKQSTTLDCGLWWGAMSWTSSLYLAALRAGEAMAREMGDEAYAKRVGSIADAGARNLIEQLWNGEYFIHKPDRSQPTSFVIGNGCHIDQVYGQAWAHQVGLGRILPVSQTRSALKALWKYNFTSDVGPYRKKFTGGRWYAMAGEGGMIMTTWPHNDREAPKQIEGGMQLGVDYLNECMSGFEHQVAGHMLGEGLVLEGLAVERSIHDRYHASRRNPWNEVECGDHYSRAMASYGVFIAACGFEYHGPKGHIGFAPCLTPEDFKAPFTAAEGWGTFEQRFEISNLKSQISNLTSTFTLKHGKLRVCTISLGLAKDHKPDSVMVSINGKAVPATLKVADGKALITLVAEATVETGGSLSAVLK